jgi:2-oxoglutarate ferredoxin oxidoreductase subunit beta
LGVLRAWGDLPRYEDVVNQQVRDVQAKRGPGNLEKLLRGGDTWRVEPR